jgi:hypothetical protein
MPAKAPDTLAAAFAVLLANLAFGRVGMHAPAQSGVPFTAAQIWTLDSTYTDRVNGVVFRYPSVWRAETSFGYHPPALTYSTEKPIAGFGYEEGSFPRDHVVGPYSSTNLEGFGIVYSAAVAANMGECDARAASISDALKPRMFVFGRRTFFERETSSAGMSQSMSGKLYATYVHPNCYLFETNVATSSAGVTDGIVSSLTPAQLREIQTHLLRIMESVRIAQAKEQ